MKRIVKGLIPCAVAVHGRKPTKQFTSLVVYDKDEHAPELINVLKAQSRWDDASRSVRVTGGNQSAESEWGSSQSLMTQKAVHRGAAKQHSVAHRL